MKTQRLKIVADKTAKFHVVIDDQDAGWRIYWCQSGHQGLNHLKHEIGAAIRKLGQLYSSFTNVGGNFTFALQAGGVLRALAGCPNDSRRVRSPQYHAHWSCEELSPRRRYSRRYWGNLTFSRKRCSVNAKLLIAWYA